MMFTDIPSMLLTDINVRSKLMHCMSIKKPVIVK